MADKDDFDFDEKDTDAFDMSDDELFGDDAEELKADTDDDEPQGSSDEDFGDDVEGRRAEQAARKDQSVKAREKMGWTIPSYQQMRAELDEKEPTLKTLIQDYKALQAKKDPSDEEQAKMDELKSEVANIRRLQKDIQTMDAHIDTILAAPADFDNIINYGSSVTDQLGELTDKLLEIQSKSTDKFTVFNDTMAQVRGIVEDRDFEQGLAFLKDRTLSSSKQVLNQAGNAAKEVGKVGSGILKSTWRALTSKKADREEKERAQELERENALLNELPEKRKQLQQAADAIEKLERSLVNHAIQVENLGKTNLNAVNELRLYIAAGDEILRIYDEELIPAAKDRFQREKTPDSETTLKNLQTSASDFFDQVLELEVVMFRARRDVLELAQQAKTNREYIKTIKKMRKNGINQWKTALAKAALQGQSMKQGRAILEHSRFGAETDDLSIEIQQASAKSAKAIQESRLNEISNLLDNQQKLKKIIEGSLQNDAEFEKKRLAGRQQLKQAEEELAELTHKSNKALASKGDNVSHKTERDAAKPTKDDDFDTTPATDGSNDNKDTGVDDIAAQVRRNRKGGAGPKK
ncbi:MAG: hypothetical protein EP349_04195 [Alphaproteobacteria bacterium]|nr:MAG: hypothetical protein EP349_04195 [Alphaproteobacteria bacterium]